MAKKLVVVTHDGIFHADEAMACAILSLAFGESPTIRRSRALGDIAAADIAVDVGGGVFDHHQRGGNGARPTGVPYASAGLIWRQYGLEAVLKGSRCLNMGCREQPTVSTDLAVEVVASIDATLIAGVDAVDCGVLAGGRHLKGHPEVEVPVYGISNIIGAMNNVEGGQTAQAGAFDNAVVWGVSVLLDAIDHAVAEATSAAFVRAAISKTTDHTVVFDEYQPAAATILAAEAPASILYFVFPDVSGSWRIQQIPDAVGGMRGRKPLPEAWAGLREEAFQHVSGVSDAVFCHPSRFIAGAKSKEGALALAAKAAEA